MYFFPVTMSHAQVGPNSQTAIARRLRYGQVNQVAPFLLLFARFLFALAAQALVAALFWVQAHAQPWLAAAAWWTVYGTLIDIATLLTLGWLTRREGLRLVDLLGDAPRRLGRDLAMGLGLTVLYVALGFLSGALTTLAVYGVTTAPVPLMGGLPRWATWYSLLVWPLIWGVAEELTYQGYALPRLQVITGRTWLALLLVTLGFGLQHSALPFRADGNFMLWRFGSSLLLGLAAALVYLRLRQLLPLIVAHWAANALSVLLLAVLATGQP